MLGERVYVFGEKESKW